MRKIMKMLIFIIAIIGISFNMDVSTIAASNKSLDVKVEVGFNDNYKVGYSTPITFTIKNNGDDIKGEVEIRVPSSPGKYMGYVKSLSLEKDAEKVVTVNVPINGNRTKYSVFIYNGDEKVYEDKVSLNMTSNNVTQFIGILSDDYDSLTYINKVPSYQGVTMMTKNIKLSEKNFPEDVFTAKAFDIIVINDFDTSKLTERQYDTLKQWVNGGGTLIIGTGANYKKSLGIFTDDFVSGVSGELKTISASKINEIATNGDNKSEINIETLSMDLKDATTVIDDNGVKLTQIISRGKGIVGIAAFDLGQAPFAGWSNNTNFAEKLIGIINPNATSLEDLKGMNIESNWYMIRDILSQFSEMAAIKTSLYYIILFIFIIIVAPVNYFILKKIDKREFMWITVPVISVVFGFVVYMSGSSTRLNRITTNVVSIFNVDSKGNASISAYAGIYSTKKSTIKLESKNGERIVPIIENYGGDPNQGITNETLEAKIYDGGNSGIEYVNSSILQSKMVQLQNSSLNIGKVETDIKMQGSKLVGTIKNSTSIELEDCYLLTPSEYYKLGDIKVGDNKEITVSGVNYGGNIYQFTDTALRYQGNMSPSSLSESEKKKYIEGQQKTSMVQLVFMNGMDRVEGLKLIAFSKTPVNNPLLVNGVEAVKNERGVLVMPLNVNFRDGDNIAYPKGFIPYNVIQSGGLNYDSYNGRFYGEGSAEIVYSLDSTMKVEEINIDTADLTYKGIPSPDMLIYNIETKAYEKLDSGKISGDVISKYLTSDNKVQIKLEVKNSDCGVPQMAARGKVK